MVIALAGPASIILILIVALLIFGPSKLPELGRAAGKTLKEFRNATKGLDDEDESNSKESQGGKE